MSKPLYRYKLLLEYDGTNYCGWQVQQNGMSIQKTIQIQLEKILRSPTNLTGSGRTDAGVHAKGQVAHFDSKQNLDQKRFLYSLNCLLPKDIRALSLSHVSNEFHARYSAIKKTYHYFLETNSVDPFQIRYRFHLHSSLDQKLLKEALSHFIGQKDFAPFANEAKRGAASYDSIRTLERFEAFEEPWGIRFELAADGFLYKMVRNLVGSAVAIAQRKTDLKEVSQLFEKKISTRSSPTMPAHGLFLIQVNYPDFLELSSNS
jgi:tRNA pseudouridine38-40 synthase